MWIRAKDHGAVNDTMHNSDTLSRIVVYTSDKQADGNIYAYGDFEGTQVLYAPDTFDEITNTADRINKINSLVNKAAAYLRGCLAAEQTHTSTTPFICDLTGDLATPFDDNDNS